MMFICNFAKNGHSGNKLKAIYIILLIIFFHYRGYSTENTLGISTGFGRFLPDKNELDKNAYSFALRYSYYTSRNISFGLNSVYNIGLQGYHTIYLIDPFCGYRFNIHNKIYPEIKIGWGLAILSTGEIPDFSYNVGGEVNVIMPVTERISIGPCYQMFYKYSNVYGIIDQIAIEFKLKL